MGEPPRRCTAHSTRTGEQCRHRPIVGGTVCATHGGKAPQVLRAAARRQEAQRIETRLAALVVSMEGQCVDDPHVIIRAMLRRSQMVMQAYESMLVDDPECRLLVEVDYGKAGGIRREQHPVAALWDRERDRLSKLAVEAAKVGLAQRQVEIEEEQAREISTVVLEGLNNAGLSPEDLQRAKAAIASRMRMLSAS
jgi:hypothetical protein